LINHIRQIAEQLCWMWLVNCVFGQPTWNLRYCKWSKTGIKPKWRI